MHPMELLDEVYHMESYFSPVGDSISDANPLGFLPDLLMRDGDNSIGGWR